MFPEFRTTRLRLTRIRSDDAQCVFDIFSDPPVVEFYDIGPFKSMAEAEQLIELFESRSIPL